MRGNHKSRTPNHKPRGGGGSRARTGGIQLAKLALYQLSYAPGAGRLSRRVSRRFAAGRLCGPGGCGRIIRLLRFRPDALFEKGRSTFGRRLPAGPVSLERR